MDGEHIQILMEFKAWTFANHPEEAAVMWEADEQTWPVQVFTSESAALHRRLGAEYVAGLTG